MRDDVTAMLSAPFEQAMAAVVTRAADLLRAPVMAVDERGVVVAVSGDARRHWLGRRGADVAACDDPRIPVQINGHTGFVIVAREADGDALAPHLAHAIVELTVNQVTVVERLPNLNELKNRLIHGLLRGAVSDEADVLREAQILGMDLARPRAVILIDASEYILARGSSDMLNDEDAWVASSRMRARSIISSVASFFSLPTEMICAYIGDGEIAVLKASSTRDLSPWAGETAPIVDEHPTWANLAALKRAVTDLLARLRRDTDPSISIGIGRYHQGTGGLARSYADAHTALTLGRRLGRDSGMCCLDDLGMAALVTISDDDIKRDLARRLLSPLDHQPELRQTLDVFFAESCSPVIAAKRLEIHRNTLGYRLEKIARLTGLDPRQFDDAIQLRLAGLICSLGRAGAVVQTPNHTTRVTGDLGQPPDAPGRLAPVA